MTKIILQHNYCTYVLEEESQLYRVLIVHISQRIKLMTCLRTSVAACLFINDNLSESAQILWKMSKTHIMTVVIMLTEV